MTQLDLFERATDEEFERFIHTPQGAEIANKFIRLAWAMKKRGGSYGAKAIVERLRWHYQIVKREPDAFKINNNWTSRLARFAEKRVPELRGLFKMRKLRS